MSNWFRIWIPSWRFFNRVEVLSLWWRSDENWQPLWPRPRTPWYGLLWNPAAGLHHARMNLARRLVEEVGSLPQPPASLVSYRLLDAMVRASLARGTSYQFKICLDDHDLLLSVKGQA